jgi:hypothetical protein
MGAVTMIGLDLAKNLSQVYCVDADGAAVLWQRLTRGRMLKFFGEAAAVFDRYRGLRLITLLGTSTHCAGP